MRTWSVLSSALFILATEVIYSNSFKIRPYSERISARQDHGTCSGGNFPNLEAAIQAEIDSLSPKIFQLADIQIEEIIRQTLAALNDAPGPFSLNDVTAKLAAAIAGIKVSSAGFSLYNDLEKNYLQAITAGVIAGVNTVDCACVPDSQTFQNYIDGLLTPDNLSAPLIPGFTSSLSAYDYATHLGTVLTAAKFPHLAAHYDIAMLATAFTYYLSSAEAANVFVEVVLADLNKMLPDSISSGDIFDALAAAMTNCTTTPSPTLATPAAGTVHRSNSGNSGVELTLFGTAKELGKYILHPFLHAGYSLYLYVYGNAGSVSLESDLSGFFFNPL